MRTLLILLLIGLAFSLHFSRTHLEEESSSDSEESEADKEWKEYMDKCERDYRRQFRAAANCEGMKPEACKLAKAMMESFGIIKSEQLCIKIVDDGKQAFQACANKKCKGKADNDCGKHHCSDEVNDALKAAAKKHEDEMEKEALDFDSVQLEPMGDEEKKHWEHKTDECKEEIIPIFKEAFAKQKCAEGDIACITQKAVAPLTLDVMSGDICKNMTKEAVTFYETCSRMNCGGKRDDDCLKHKCKKSLHVFWEMTKKAVAQGPPGGFASQHGEDAVAVNPLAHAEDAASEAEPAHA